MIHIKVPATSANMGSGFDSIGIALQLYNELWVEEIEKGIEIEVKNKQSVYIPEDENNLIYKTIANFYTELGMKVPGLRLIQADNIPLTRGLGSSAACVVAGLTAANALSGKNYSKYELASIAAKLEGHADNSNPAILGGMVVSALSAENMQYVKFSVPEFLNFAVMIPDFTVATENARNILPKTVSHEDAVFNASRSALLVASMISGNTHNLRMAVEDKLHQSYRIQLVPGMESIISSSYTCGAKATYLSGAGPAMISIVEDNDIEEFKIKMFDYLVKMPYNWSLEFIKPDYEGSKIISD